MAIVIDDATILAVLTGQAGSTLADAGPGEIVTTGSWYYRLHHALHDPGSSGSLSKMAAKLPAPAQETLLLLALDDLPPRIVVPGPRLLVPVMGAFRLRQRVNHLAAEALAAAVVSEAAIRVSTESPLLRRACGELDIRLELLPPFA